MISVNELPTMDFHFFESPNKIMITEASFNQIITAELDFDFDFDFVLDSKSFDVMKKLSTSRTIRKEQNAVIIESREGKYKCSMMVKEKPELRLTETVYEHSYDVNVLKEATRFVSDNKARAVLTGVLLNDVGDVFASDTIKFFYSRPEILSYSRFWSVPTYFIGLLPQKEITLKFTNAKVFYEGDFNIYSSFYDSKVPAVEKVCDDFVSDKYITLDKRDELNLLPSDSVEFEITNDKATLIFDDNEKQFKVEYDIHPNYEFKARIGFDNFNQMLAVVGDKMFIEFGEKSLRINKKIIVSYRR